MKKTAKKKATKKRNYGATEGTWRNVRAAKKRSDTIKKRVERLEVKVRVLARMEQTLAIVCGDVARLINWADTVERERKHRGRG